MTLRLYVNGALDGSTTPAQAGSIITTTQPYHATMWIGRIV